MAKELTEMQERFCQEYIIDLNATQAAIRAGYSEKTAYSQGQRLLKKVEIQERIRELMEERKSELIASQNEVLETLTRILRREEQETVVVSCKQRKSYYDDKGKKVIEEKEEPLLVKIPTKISDVNRAAELLGKRYGICTDKNKEEQQARIDKLKAETAKLTGEAANPLEDKIGKLFDAIGGALDESE